MMKNETFLCAAASLLLFASCQAVLPPAEQTEGGTTGKAAVTIALTTGGARTVLPQVSLADVSRFTLSGAQSGGAAAELASFTSSAGAQVYLEPGTWDFILNAYNSSDALILQGSAESQSISLSGGNTITFTLLPLESGQGSISITIDCPAVITRVSAAVDGGAESGANLTLNDTASGKRAVYAETRSAGSYFIVLRFYDGDNTLRGVVSELAVVAGNLSSAKTLVLAEGDLKAAAGVFLSAAGSADFADALSAIQGNTTDSRFTITVTADISLDPQDLSGAAYQNKTITIKGDTPGRTISLNSVGSLFTVGADVALEVEDITLVGIDDTAGWNNASLISVNDGSLVLNDGAKIMGNHYNAGTPCGGGVYVSGSNAVFTMNGGEISDNEMWCNAAWGSFCYGGGVYIDTGAVFVMNGGKISENFSGVDRETSRGGGVYLNTGATFTMNGGEISNNIIVHNPNFSPATGETSEGGGIYVKSGATFTMNGGDITGNGWLRNSGYGAGVWNAGTFTMNGGKISGNQFSGNYDDWGGGPAGYGNGGGVWTSGSFIMRGGEISGNYIYGRGGGVYVDSGTFVKAPNGAASGGVIYGSESAAELKNSATSDGQAVYVNGGSRRNATAGQNANLDSGVSGSSGGWD